MADWDILTAIEEFLVYLSHGTLEKGGRIGEHIGRITVVKLSPGITVKLGPGITASEAATQDFAHKNLDPSVVCVPEVYRYVERRRSTDKYGYHFMEYVGGQNLQDHGIESLAKFVPRVVKIVRSLGHIGASGLTPGPVGAGIPLEYIYGDNSVNTCFTSVEEMNVYMNKRSAYRNDTIDLSRHPLVLCHGDLCRRNIILRDDGSLCLVDWGFAGYYPRFFEIVALKCTIPYDKVFEGALESETEAMMGLTDEERHDMKLVTFVRGAIDGGHCKAAWQSYLIEAWVTASKTPKVTARHRLNKTYSSNPLSNMPG